MTADSYFLVYCYKIEELLFDIKAMEEEVVRWREACELEVEAGKTEIEERDKVVNTRVQYELLLTKVAFPN